MDKKYKMPIAKYRKIVLLIALNIGASSITNTLAMTWASTWKDILRGGSTRWKVDDINVKRQSLGHILAHTNSLPGSNKSHIHIFCPLAGDDPFVYYAWQQGHAVTSIDLVPDAVALMRQQFGQSKDEWDIEKNGSTVIWKHKSGRATLYEGDVLENRPELMEKFDAVYDKDSFGALDPKMRRAFCQRLASYTKNDAVVYMEVKYKIKNNEGRKSGPPYHLEKDDIMKLEYFGGDFEYVTELGKVYDLTMGGMEQTGHVLRRSKAR